MDSSQTEIVMNQITSYVTITVAAGNSDVGRQVLLITALVLGAFALGMVVANAVWLNDK